MKTRIVLSLLILLIGTKSRAADVYGATTTAQAMALGGNYLGASGPTDALSSNPADLTSIAGPYLEFTGMSVFGGGSFHNSTPYVGSLKSNMGVTGSAGFGVQIPGTRITLGAGAFPVSLLSDRWTYQDPSGTAGASYGVQSNKSAFLAIQSSIGAGYRVSRWLSIGAAFGVVENLNTLEMPYIFQANPTLAGLKTLLNLHTSGLGYNGVFGLVAQPARRLTLGAAYKTRTTVRSFGNASGNAYAQFEALGLSVPSDFRYRAEVDNVFPQSASLSMAWQTQLRTRVFLQGDWINWRTAFNRLPVHLTGGNNALLNALLGSTSLNDSVPLHWRNQATVRAGLDHSLTETLTLQAAYSHANSPVPSSTLTPLTAAIMTDALSAGIGYRKGRYGVELAYQANLPATASVASSGLLAGEYSGTRTNLWLQTVALTTGVRF